MISGEYRHTVDSKNRMFLPAKLREELGENIVMTKNVDKCISLYPLAAWKAFTDKINALPEIQSRKIKRFIYAAAVEIQPDAQGRILFAQNLKEYASIEKDVAVIGVGDHAEVWDGKLWDAETNSENNCGIADMMIDLGF